MTKYQGPAGYAINFRGRTNTITVEIYDDLREAIEMVEEHMVNMEKHVEIERIDTLWEYIKRQAELVEYDDEMLEAVIIAEGRRLAAKREARRNSPKTQE